MEQRILRIAREVMDLYGDFVSYEDLNFLTVRGYCNEVLRGEVRREYELEEAIDGYISPRRYENFVRRIIRSIRRNRRVG